MSASKKPIGERLAGLKQCGCTDHQLCPQHIDQLPPEQRRLYVAKHRKRGTGRGRRAGRQ